MADHDVKEKDGSLFTAPDVEIGETTATKDADKALEFLQRQGDIGPLTQDVEKKLLRKIDFMIMPLMWACYFLQYLDKTLSR
jgi:hypothetical protein